ncbi:MAG: ATP-binding cassette domain-containing protein, partial [Verrucomicrobiales bacterium]|nr:ATP-binding cassette domain-containing protein [Verrucomicrobiales bacterium]
MLGEVKEQPVIEIEALSVERSGRGVDHGIGLRNVSLQLKRGEVMVLAGEHGCGTSLLGSLILGVAEPGTRVMSGSILFEGEELIKARRSRKRQLRREEISYLPRNIEEQFNPNHTVRQCLRETAKLMGRNKPALPESEWSDPFYRVGIVEPERVLLRRISELSHLMIRKLGLMRALLTQSQ